MFNRSLLPLAGLLFSVAIGAVAQPPNPDFTPIEPLVKQELESTATPGAAIGIVKDGRLVYAEGFGTRNLETHEPVTAETLFRLGSTTKMLTATAVASLAADGKLDFADPVGKHIHGLNPAIAALTVNQILSHTSGLKDEAVINGRHDDEALGREIHAWNAGWLFTRPGAIYSYANPGYWLAGYLAECVAGEPYAQVMDERVFGPVGMTFSTLRPTMAMTRTLSQGHDLVDKKLSVLRPAPDNAANWPAGSVFSNLVDLSRFVTAMMNDGKLEAKQALSPKVISALTAPHAQIPGSAAKYGYGLDLDASSGVLVWSHGGARAGYGSFIAMIPSQHTAVIVLCNRTGRSLPATRARIMAILGHPSPSDPDIESAIDPADFSKYTGSYRNSAQTVQIVEREGKLYVGTAELRKGSRGWLILKTPDGKIAGRAFPVPGAGGTTEYLHIGGRSAARM